MGTSKSNSDVSIENTERWVLCEGPILLCQLWFLGIEQNDIEVVQIFVQNMFPKSPQQLWDRDDGLILILI